jgi:hypothetical protein
MENSLNQNYESLFICRLFPLRKKLSVYFPFPEKESILCGRFAKILNQQLINVNKQKIVACIIENKTIECSYWDVNVFL